MRTIIFASNRNEEFSVLAMGLRRESILTSTVLPGGALLYGPAGPCAPEPGRPHALEAFPEDEPLAGVRESGSAELFPMGLRPCGLSGVSVGRL